MKLLQHLVIAIIAIAVASDPSAAQNHRSRPAADHAESRDHAGAWRRISRNSAWPMRRIMIGSSPPKCEMWRSCGECRPCRAVLVPIHKKGNIGGAAKFSSDPDYYPQAWRCACHGRIF